MTPKHPKTTKEIWMTVLKVAGVLAGGYIAIVFVLPLLNEWFGLDKPLVLTQGHFWMLLITFSFLFSRFDQLNQQLKVLDEIKSDVSEVRNRVVGT